MVLHGAELLVDKINHEEFEAAVSGLKNWKTSGSDSIAAELIKYGDEKCYQILYKLLNKIWVEDQLPTVRKELIMIMLHEKRNELEYDNYRGRYITAELGI